MRSSNLTFKGINDKAPIQAEGEQEVPVGIAGKGCLLRFQRLATSRSPMLISVGQLRALQAVLDLTVPSVTFKSLGVTVPIVFSDRGHPTIRIDEWPAPPPAVDDHDDIDVKTTPTLRTVEVDVWKADDVEHDDRKSMTKKTRRVLLKTEDMVEKTLDAGRVALESLRAEFAYGGEPHKTLLVELHAGNMPCTLAADARGHAVSQPRDRILGHDLLNRQCQDEVLDQLWTDNPYMVIIPFPRDHLGRLEGLKHLRFLRRVWDNCLQRGCHLLLEGPLSSQAWTLLPWLAEFELAGIYTKQGDEEIVDCLGYTVTQPTRFFTSSACLARVLDNMRFPCQHLGNCTSEIADAIIDGIFGAA